MADIHIGKSLFNKKKDLIEVQFFFHVPNSKDNNFYPGLVESLDSAGNPIPVSSAPGITVGELENLKNGDLCEISDLKLFEYDGSVERRAEIKVEIRSLWQGIADKKQVELDKEYPFYGVTLARAGV